MDTLSPSLVYPFMLSSYLAIVLCCCPQFPPGFRTPKKRLLNDAIVINSSVKGYDDGLGL